MKFHEAVKSTPSIGGHLKSGLKALKNADRGRVSCDGRHLRGSVDIDSALRGLYPDDARWDYAVGLVGREHDSVAWLEVHPASSLHVDEALSELRWLVHWLEMSAPELKILPRRFCWIATGTISFSRSSAQARKVAREGGRLRITKRRPLCTSCTTIL